MSGNRFWRVCGEVLFWCLVAAFFVWVAILRNESKAQRTINDLEVVVYDSQEMQFVTTQSVISLLESAEINPIGTNSHSLDLMAINDLVESLSFVSEARSFYNHSGVLTIEIHQRKPVARVITSQGHDIYLSKDMCSLPVQGGTPLNLPLITGDVPLPVEVGFVGSLRDESLRAKKNYEENYNFLYKLINFVELTEQTPAWRDSFVQIVATQSPQSAESQLFMEPNFELIPRQGDYTLEIGTLDNASEKLLRWEKFIRASVVDTTGGVVNVEYDNQVLWRAPKSDKKKTK